MSWSAVRIYIFSAAEISAGIICSSTPILVALFRSNNSPTKDTLRFLSLRYFGSLFTRSSTNSKTGFGQQSGSVEKLHVTKKGSGANGNGNDLGGEWIELRNTGGELGSVRVG